MKITSFLFLTCLVYIPCKGQVDSLLISSPGRNFMLPQTNEMSVEYQRVYEFDSKTKPSEIFSSIKPSLAEFYNKASIGLNNRNAIFKMYSDNPIIYEDKELGRLSIQLSFKTMKHDGEPDDIKSDMIVFCKADFIVKDNKMKMILRDVNLYYQSGGAALLVGVENSLLVFPFNNIKDHLNASVFYSSNDYLGKRIFTVDYKIRKLFDDVQVRVKSYLNSANF